MGSNASLSLFMQVPRCSNNCFKFGETITGRYCSPCGFLVAIFMSVMWRFDLIPDIRPIMRTSPTLMGSRTRTMANIVVVTVTCEDVPNAQVTIQFFTPSETGSDSLTPLESRNEQLDGGIKEFLVTDLARGAVAGIAYIDLNGNGQLDIADDGTSMEPFAFASAKSS